MVWYNPRTWPSVPWPFKPEDSGQLYRKSGWRVREGESIIHDWYYDAEANFMSRDPTKKNIYVFCGTGKDADEAKQQCMRQARNFVSRIA